MDSWKGTLLLAGSGGERQHWRYQPLAMMGCLGPMLSHVDQTNESPPWILTYSERLNSDLEHTPSNDATCPESYLGPGGI